MGQLQVLAPNASLAKFSVVKIPQICMLDERQIATNFSKKFRIQSRAFDSMVVPEMLVHSKYRFRRVQGWKFRYFAVEHLADATKAAEEKKMVESTLARFAVWFA